MMSARRAQLSENIFVPPTVVLRFSLLSREASRALVSQISRNFFFFRRTIYVSTCICNNMYSRFTIMCLVAAAGGGGGWAFLFFF